MDDIVCRREESKRAGRALSYAPADVQVSPEQGPGDALVMRVVKTPERGIFVNGVKTIGVFVVQSDEVVVGDFSRGELEDRDVVSLSTSASRVALARRDRMRLVESDGRLSESASP